MPRPATKTRCKKIKNRHCDTQTLYEGSEGWLSVSHQGWACFPSLACMPGQPTERDKCILDPFVRDPILREMSIGSLYVVPDVVATLSKVFGRIFLPKNPLPESPPTVTQKGKVLKLVVFLHQMRLKMDRNWLKMDQQGLRMD